jgi:ketol-acid reductoisomerase
VRQKSNKMAKMNFGGVEENVVTREEFPLSKAQEVLKDEIIAVIGYGVQGPVFAECFLKDVV